jgi:hypothetical protein
MAAMAVVLSAPLGQAEVTTIEPVADTSLFEWLHNYNFGAQDDLPAGGLGGLAGDERLARALFKFDIAAALPAGAQIVEAKLRLEMTKAPEDSPRTSDFALYRVLVDWGEGNKSGETHGGAIATAGEATWEYRFSDNVAWSVGGGQFGVDFADEQSALMPGVAGVGDYIFDFNATGVADVQAALDDPGTNFGWALKSEGEALRKTARRWASREAPAGSRPELEVTWVMPVPVPEITSFEVDPDSGEVIVRVDGLAGYSYQLLTSGDLLSWAPGETQTPSSDGELSFEAPFVESGQFLRVEATEAP